MGDRRESPQGIPQKMRPESSYYLCLWNKHSVYSSLCPAVLQQKLLYSPWFGALKATIPMSLLLRRSVFCWQTPVWVFSFQVWSLIMRALWQPSEAIRPWSALANSKVNVSIPVSQITSNSKCPSQAQSTGIRSIFPDWNFRIQKLVCLNWVFPIYAGCGGIHINKQRSGTFRMQAGFASWHILCM